MKYDIALSALLLASSALAKPSPPLPELIDFANRGEGNLRGRDLQTACTPSVEVSLSSFGGCFGLGQKINVTVTTCPTPFPEWVGIFSEDDEDWKFSNNWLYCCGDQDCKAPVAGGTYSFTFDSETAGADDWPLTDSFGEGGGTYNIFFHSAYGSFQTSVSIQITPGYFCEGPFAGVPAEDVPPEFVPCPLVNFTLPCFDIDSNSTTTDSDDGDEPCQKITPGQGGIPPGKGGIPPGLQCKDFIPPGIAKKLPGAGAN